MSGPTSGPFGYTEKGTFFIDSQFAGFPDSIDLVYQGFVWAFTMNYPGQVTRLIATFIALPDHESENYLHPGLPAARWGAHDPAGQSQEGVHKPDRRLHCQSHWQSLAI